VKNTEKRKDAEMAISQEEVMATLTPERRARIEARAQELIEEETAIDPLHCGRGVNHPIGSKEQVRS